MLYKSPRREKSVLMGGGPALMYATMAYKIPKEFLKEQSPTFFFCIFSLVNRSKLANKI